jgi:hypothetical protein
MTIVRTLFRTNNLSLENLRIDRFSAESPTDLIPTAESGIFYHVRCTQFVSGMEVFSQELIYHFKDSNRFYGISGHRVEAPGVDTLPKISMDVALAGFCKSIGDDHVYTDSLESFMRKGFTAELGYYQLEPGHLTLMWRLNVVDRLVPESYIRADSIAVPRYDNGVRY